MPGAQMASPSRLSTDSGSSQSSDRSEPSSGSQSTSALILVHDRDDDDRSFSFTDEEDAHEDSSVSEVILSPSLVFGYFLSPYLKLGSMLILSSQIPLKVSLPALLVFSFLSVFSRQIWFLLARYVRKSDVADIVGEAVARGQGKDGLRTFARSATHVGSGMVHILLATVYLKGAKNCIEPFWPADVFPISSSLALSVVFIVFLSPISVAPTLASRRLVYSTGISNALYIAWLCAVIYAHASGALNTDIVIIAQGRLLSDISSIAFTFSSLSNLRIYSGMVGLNSSGDKKEKRYLSISSISFSAALVGMGLVLPTLFPSVKSHGDEGILEGSSLAQPLIATLTTFILLLAIPPLISTCPPLTVPLTFRRIAQHSSGKYSFLVLLFILSVLPRSFEPVLEDIVVLLVLLSTYFLPALLHIILHNMRRPISIIVNPQPLLRSVSSLVSDDAEASLCGHDWDTAELLLRKERALQRRRFGRRVMWDIGVWVLLVPVGGGGMTWAVGRLANAW